MISAGVRGLGLNYVVTQNDCAAELYIDRGKDTDEENKQIFEQLAVNREEIEKSVADKISWEPMDGCRAARVRISTEGGYRSPEEEWDSTQNKIIAAMNSLDAALKPHIKKLRLGN